MNTVTSPMMKSGGSLDGESMKQKLTFSSLMTRWIQPHLRNGFSLVEVNMAIFVMAMGILSMAVLFPLGLRESNQGFADLKQASLADYLLNQAVAAAQLPDVKWSEWQRIPWLESKSDNSGVNLKDLPPFIEDKMDYPEGSSERYVIRCCRPAGFSGRRMAFFVQSTEMKNLTSYNQYSNNPVFYAEAYFRGRPDK